MIGQCAFIRHINPRELETNMVMAKQKFPQLQIIFVIINRKGDPAYGTKFGRNYSLKKESLLNVLFLMFRGCKARRRSELEHYHAVCTRKKREGKKRPRSIYHGQYLSKAEREIGRSQQSDIERLPVTTFQNSPVIHNNSISF